MKLVGTSIVCLLLVKFSFAQNILVNSDLEKFNICPERGGMCSPAGWFYFRSSPEGYVNPGWYGKTPSASGDRHLNLRAADTTENGRDYWQTKLLCPLIPGKKYEARIKITTAKADPNLNDIGFWLTDRFVVASQDTILTPEKYINFLDGKVSKEKNGWFLIRKEFTADEVSTILVVGNFSSEKNSYIREKRNHPKLPVTIFIDDIEINTTKSSACIINTAIMDSLFAETRRHSGIWAAKTKTSVDPVRVDPLPIKKPVVEEKQVFLQTVDTLLLQNIEFDVNSFTIKDSSVIHKLASSFDRADEIIHIEVLGYTDASGTESYNKELSELRANSVAKMIAYDFKIPQNVFSVAGMGISHDFDKDYLNRRVEIRITRRKVILQ